MKRAGRKKRAAAAAPKPSQATRSRKGTQRRMWVETADGVVWVEGDAATLPDPDAVRAKVLAEREQAAERAREVEREAARRALEAQRKAEPFRFRCPDCGAWFETSRDRRGELVRCACGAKMLVPTPDGEREGPIAIECLRCGAPHLPSLGRCEKCGDPLPTRRACVQCGSMWLRPSIEFCPRCGLELEKAGG